MTAPETTINKLQNDAWSAWNASHHERDSETLREVGRDLYLQAWHERVKHRLAELDAQNARLDELLAARASTEHPRAA
ncbi:MAG: hypothetical protein NVSMB22_16460 [Chloroflexota bacterium]